jgi:hypothetical protein
MEDDQMLKKIILGIFITTAALGAGTVIYKDAAIFKQTVQVNSLTASRALVSDASKLLSSSAVTSTELGYVSGVTSAIQTQFGNKQGLDATLTALAAYNTNGLLAQTSADTFVGRTITGTANEITVTDGDGVSGNPTLSVPVVIDFGGKTSFEIVNSTSPTVDAAGEIAIDTDTDGNLVDQGLIVHYDGITKLYNIAVDALPSTDNHVLVYDSTADKFQFEAQSGGVAGTPSYVRAYTGNGFGSSNVKIRRFATNSDDSGTDIDYSDSTAGGTFTIQTSGIYSMAYCDEGDTGAPAICISVNASGGDLTTDCSSLAASKRLVISSVGTGNSRACVAVTHFLNDNDVVMAHTNSGTAWFISNGTGANFFIAGPLH